MIINKTHHYELDERLKEIGVKIASATSESEAVVEINRIVELIEDAAQSMQMKRESLEEVF